MTRLLNRVRKLETKSEVLYAKKSDFQTWVENLPDLWLDALINEIDKFKSHPEIEECLWIIDESSPRDGHLNFKISVPGESDFEEFVSDPEKKIAEYPEHFMLFIMDLSSDF